MHGAHRNVRRAQEMCTDPKSVHTAYRARIHETGIGLKDTRDHTLAHTIAQQSRDPAEAALLRSSRIRRVCLRSLCTVCGTARGARRKALLHHLRGLSMNCLNKTEVETRSRWAVWAGSRRMACAQGIARTSWWPTVMDANTTLMDGQRRTLRPSQLCSSSRSSSVTAAQRRSPTGPRAWSKEASFRGSATTEPSGSDAQPPGVDAST